jgi:2-polyprenyl-6-methoxyphenol hydroxylase-like FAD-dependent oxidoreductase
MTSIQATTAVTTGPVADAGTHGVVIGGSIAGLLAARVLAGHVDRVTLVERDALPEGAEHRKGVPQGRQVHALLDRGRQVIDRLFPGYSADLAAAGAVPVRVPAEMALLTPFGWLDRRALGWEMLSASRPVFEAIVRRRLRELPNVTVLERHEATGLQTLRREGVVDCVRVREVETGREQLLGADLVVDAAGRGSRTPHWLAELRFPAPEQTKIDPNIAYASRIYRIPDGFDADWKCVMLSSQPPSMPRTGFLFPIEGGQWLVSLMGAAGQHPPIDENGFAEFARSLRDPVIADAISRAEPVTPIRSHRGTTNQQWHFEKMSRWPQRYIVIGDAVCAFNPIYGQGMSVAAIGAETLDECLRLHRTRHPEGDLDGVAARFQRQLARRNADPWMLSTGEDLRFPTTTGAERSARTRAMHRYLDRVVTAATRDPEVADAYVRALGMTARPTVLFGPHALAAAVRTRPHPHSAAPAVTLPRPRSPQATETREDVR